MKTIRADVLDIAYQEHGPQDGPPVILLHGFPYDVQAYAQVAPRLTAQGCRVLIPWLRGYGPSRFVASGTIRSGQQAALAADLLAFMDALGIQCARLGGYDWGGRAAVIVAALYPDRVTGLLSAGVGYNLQDIPNAMTPASPAQEARLWYQYLFHVDRGRRLLEQDRHAMIRLLWRLWSPTWVFTADTYTASAPSFDNPDFVDTVIHSYRHRYGLVAGDPAYLAMEARLEAQPEIAVPTTVLLGAGDGVTPPDKTDRTRARFTGPYTRHILPGIGHNVPQEAPRAFADAILSLPT